MQLKTTYIVNYNKSNGVGPYCLQVCSTKDEALSSIANSNYTLTTNAYSGAPNVAWITEEELASF